MRRDGVRVLLVGDDDDGFVVGENDGDDDGLMVGGTVIVGAELSPDNSCGSVDKTLAHFAGAQLLTSMKTRKTATTSKGIVIS